MITIVTLLGEILYTIKFYTSESSKTIEPSSVESTSDETRAKADQETETRGKKSCLEIYGTGMYFLNGFGHMHSPAHMLN